MLSFVMPQELLHRGGQSHGSWWRQDRQGLEGRFDVQGNIMTSGTRGREGKGILGNEWKVMNKREKDNILKKTEGK